MTGGQVRSHLDSDVSRSFRSFCEAIFSLHLQNCTMRGRLVAPLLWIVDAESTVDVLALPAWRGWEFIQNINHLLFPASVALPSLGFFDFDELKIASLCFHLCQSSVVVCQSVQEWSLCPVGDRLCLPYFAQYNVSVSYLSCKVTETVVYVCQFFVNHSADVHCVRLHSMHHLNEFPLHYLEDVAVFLRTRICLNIQAH